MSWFLLCMSYLQCQCAWYSQPPPPEFPAVVCGSPGYQPPYGSAAGCGGQDLSRSRYGPWLLRHHRPSSSFAPGAVDKIALFPLTHSALTTTQPDNAHSDMNDKFWGLETISKGSKCQTTPGSGVSSPRCRVAHRAKYKIQLSEMRSFNASLQQHGLYC